MSLRIVFSLCVAFPFVTQVLIADEATEKKLLQGQWEVTELVEDGKVIPREAIREWLPSGGKIEINENALMFKSLQDGARHVKLFSLDVTSYPKQIDLSTREGKDGWGIYQFDKGKLIVCLTDPTASKRPTEFSAKAGSEQMLMVLERPAKPEVAPPTAKKPEGVVGKLITDAEVSQILKGTWRFSDNLGNLFTTFNADGTFSTVREVQELRLFQKVFVQTPVSTGRWTVKNGRVAFVVLTSIHIDRLNKEFDFAVRSITERDLIFVDALGRIGQSVKVK